MLANAECETQSLETEADRYNTTATNREQAESDRVRRWLVAEEDQLRLGDDAPIARTVSWHMLRRLRKKEVQGVDREDER